jgi:hypothetical protein
MPSRMAARSTTHGTPVKSCSRTRAGMNEISFSPMVFGDHDASASMSPALTNPASSRRSRFSRRIFSEYGSVATAGNFAASAGRL